MKYFLFRVYWDTQSEEEALGRIFIQAHEAEEAEQILLNKLRICQYYYIGQSTLEHAERTGFSIIKYE